MKNTFLNAIRNEYPNENITRLVFADWCLENQPNLENKLRKHIPIIDGLNYENLTYYNEFVMGGDGFGYGYGHGIFGSGYGNGQNNGEINTNYGPFRIMNGIGSVINYQNPKLNMPKLYSNQMIILPHNFIVCGFVQEHIQPYQFKLTNASVILSTNLKTRKLNTITIGPQFFHSIDWIGNLP